MTLETFLAQQLDLFVYQQIVLVHIFITKHVVLTCYFLQYFVKMHANQRVSLWMYVCD